MVNTYKHLQIKKVQDAMQNCLFRIAKATGIKCTYFGIGSTPCCSQPVSDMKKVNEMHPGNYVFYGKDFDFLNS
jgi:hypothetical protein